MRLLTGSNGAIGKNIKEFLPSMLCPTHSELDLTDRQQVRDYLHHHNPEQIIHCASNDKEVCLYDNLRMFVNLAESNIPMIIFSTGRDIEDRPGKVGEYILSKHIAQELSLHKYHHIAVIKIWGCFGKYEKESRFLTDNMLRVKRGEPILVKSDKLFSYVYVKDLVRIIKDFPIETGLTKIVGYTELLSDYAGILKKITRSPYDIIVESQDLCASYHGQNNFNFDYTPLETAIKEYWDDFNHNSK